MPPRFQVVFDFQSPDRKAAFWAEALSYQVERGFPAGERVGFAAVRDEPPARREPSACREPPADLG